MTLYRVGIPEGITRGLRSSGGPFFYSHQQVRNQGERQEKYPVVLGVRRRCGKLILGQSEKLNERHRVQDAVRQDGVRQVRRSEKEVSQKNPEGHHAEEQLRGEVYDSEEHAGEEKREHPTHVPAENALDEPAKDELFGYRDQDADPDKRHHDGCSPAGFQFLQPLHVVVGRRHEFLGKRVRVINDHNDAECCDEDVQSQQPMRAADEKLLPDPRREPPGDDVDGEDDPQNGFDHVDGHRSLCLVVSPYTKRGAVVSKFYNQTSVLHTMSRMFGIPPMNQMVAAAPLMTDCFNGTPNFSSYRCRPNQVPLDEMNKEVSELQGAELHWALQSIAEPFEEVDRADEDTLNRILWHSVKGVDAPYPAHLAGAHGRGLQALGLRLGGAEIED